MGAWGITIRQSDDGLDLLDTIVAEQLRKVNFTVFNDYVGEHYDPVEYHNGIAQCLESVLTILQARR